MILLLLLTAVTLTAHATTTTVPHQGEPPPPIGINTNGTSVFTNYDNLKEKGQAFLLYQASFTFETPGQNITYVAISWLSAATFSVAPLPPAVNARVVGCLNARINSAKPGKTSTAKAQLYSSSYSAQVNAMEAVITPTDGDWTNRFWDDGLPVNNVINWEGDDAGDQSDNAATSALAGFGTYTWISVDEAAVLLNVSVTELTPEKFNDAYAAAWERTHPPNEPTPSPTPPASGTERMAFSVTAFVTMMVTMMAMF